MEPELETAIEIPSEDNYQSLERRVILLWLLYWLPVPVIVSGSAFGAIFLPHHYQSLAVWSLLGTALFLAVVGTIYVFPHYRIWAFQVLDDAVFLKRGVVFRERTYVPHVRIQHIDTQRGPLERVLGLSRLVVFTAGTRGSDVTIPGLSTERARELQQTLRTIISRDKHRDEDAV